MASPLPPGESQHPIFSFTPRKILKKNRGYPTSIIADVTNTDQSAEPKWFLLSPEPEAHHYPTSTDIFSQGQNITKTYPHDFFPG